MSYKIQITLDITLESKQDVDLRAHRIMASIENYVEEYVDVLSAVAIRNTRDEFILNLPDSEFEPGIFETKYSEEKK